MPTLQTRINHFRNMSINVDGVVTRVDGEGCVEVDDATAATLLAQGSTWSTDVKRALVPEARAPGTPIRGIVEFMARLREDDALRAEIAKLKSFASISNLARAAGFTFSRVEYTEAVRLAASAEAKEKPPSGSSKKSGDKKGSSKKANTPVDAPPPVDNAAASVTEPEVDMTSMSIDELRTLAVAAGIVYDDETPRDVLIAQLAERGE